MDEREQLIIWKEVLAHLREAAQLMRALPHSEEVEAVLAELQGWSPNWEITDQPPGEGPLLFNRVFADLRVLEGRVLGPEGPNPN